MKSYRLLIILSVLNLNFTELKAQHPKNEITLMADVKDSFTKYGVSGAKYVIMKFDGTVVYSSIVSEGYDNKSPRYVNPQKR
jgi:hypothetical protein